MLRGLAVAVNCLKLDIVVVERIHGWVLGREYKMLLGLGVVRTTKH